MLEACLALVALVSVDLEVLVLAALDSVDLAVLVLVALDSVDLVALASVAQALVAPASVALVSVDLSVHVVLISKSGSDPLGPEVLHDAHRVDPQGSEGRASIFQKVVGAEFGVDDNDRCVERFGGLVTDERWRFFRQHAGVENH